MSELSNVKLIAESNNFELFGITSSELVSSGILTIILALVGWLFIYHNSRVLQKRNETWAIVKNISDLLQQIESKSKEFWLSIEDNQNALLYEADINSNLNELERWLEHLTLRVKKTSSNDNYKKCIVDLFKDSTLDTEIKNKMNAPQKLKRIVLLQKHTKNIKSNIDHDFENTFL